MLFERGEMPVHLFSQSPIFPLLSSTAMFEEVKGLESWYLAGANLSQGDYTNRTALHVVRNNRVILRRNYFVQ